MLLVGLLTAEEKLILVAPQEPPPLVHEDGFLGGLSAQLFGGVGGGHVEAPYT